MKTTARRREGQRRLAAGESVEKVAADLSVDESTVRRWRTKLENMADAVAPIDLPEDAGDESDLMKVQRSLRLGLDFAIAQGDATAIASCSRALSDVLRHHQPPDDLASRLDALDDEAIADTVRRLHPRTRVRVHLATSSEEADELITGLLGAHRHDPDVLELWTATGVTAPPEVARATMAKLRPHLVHARTVAHAATPRAMPSWARMPGPVSRLDEIDPDTGAEQT